MKKVLICLASCVVFYFTFDSWESHSAPIIFPILNLLATLGMIVTGFTLGWDIMSKILPLALLLFSLQVVSAQSGVDLSGHFENIQRTRPVPSKHLVVASSIEDYSNKVDSLLNEKDENKRLLYEQVSELRSENSILKTIIVALFMLLLVTLVTLGNEIKNNKK